MITCKTSKLTSDTKIFHIYSAVFSKKSELYLLAFHKLYIDEKELTFNHSISIYGYLIIFTSKAEIPAPERGFFTSDDIYKKYSKINLQRQRRGRGGDNLARIHNAIHARSANLLYITVTLLDPGVRIITRGCNPIHIRSPH